MSRKQVLLIVEGIKQEIKLFQALFRCYGLDIGYEIVSYNTNIYELYERMFSDGFQDDLSLLGVLKERASDEDKWLFDQDYSDVLLVFDYEPQDNRFSPARLEEMQRYFNESTDNGKLYVNYPMVEACKHFLKMPDVEYLNRAVSREDVLNYKSIVGNASRYQSFERHFIRPDVDEMIVLTAIKALRLCGHNGEVGYESEYRDLDHEPIVKTQNDTLRLADEVWVLGTCLLFILDYSTGLIDFAGIESKLLG